MAGATRRLQRRRKGSTSRFFTGSTGTSAKSAEIIGDDGSQPMPPAVARRRPRRQPHGPAGSGATRLRSVRAPTTYNGRAGRYRLVGRRRPCRHGAARRALDTLAIRYGVPSNQIAIANQISERGPDLTAGRVIVIPHRRSPMPRSRRRRRYRAEPAYDSTPGRRRQADHAYRPATRSSASRKTA